MFDINLIREKPDLVRQALEKRHMDPAPVDEVQALDVERRTLLTKVEALKAERNAASKEISQMKDPAARQAKIDAMRQVGDQIAAMDEQVRGVDEKLQNLVASLPNIPDGSVPFGNDDHDNVVVATYGEPQQFAFTPQPHWELGPKLGIIDFEQGVKITGSRFYVLSGAGARLQRALIAWML
ncbi:MAG: serine--tRNA ligase, partial [Anaerolineaceae bacterium]|nr:serine--tRNA ligase [Anaerolineaceae bacterium]